MPPAPAASAAHRRLLFVSTVYPTPWEQAKGPHNRSRVEALREAGCDVHVVAPIPWQKRTGRSTPITPAETYPTYWYTPRVLRNQYHRMMDWSIGTTIERVFTEFRPDAVLAFWTDPDGTVALRHARRHGVPCGIIAGGSDIMLLTSDPARRRIIAATLSMADHVFAVGSVLHARVIGLGARADRVSNFISGVDPRLFAAGDRAAARQPLGLPPSAPVALWAGQMVAVKAVERTLDAVAGLLDDLPDLQLVLAGDGPERHRLSRAVTGSAALRDRVRFPGALHHSELAPWYRAADVFVLPSRSEGVPTVLLEAMACGLPFVASDVGSIRDLLPFGRSAVTPEGNIAALRAAISEVMHGAEGRPVPRVVDRADAAREILQQLGAT
ncbi:MAG: glycosyltransferase [Gemmatimonadales bacterium]